jgi:hypothetical protein
VPKHPLFLFKIKITILPLLKQWIKFNNHILHLSLPHSLSSSLSPSFSLSHNLFLSLSTSLSDRWIGCMHPCKQKACLHPSQSVSMSDSLPLSPSLSLPLSFSLAHKARLHSKRSSLIHSFSQSVSDYYINSTTSLLHLFNSENSFSSSIFYNLRLQHC